MSHRTKYGRQGPGQSRQHRAATAVSASSASALARLGAVQERAHRGLIAAQNADGGWGAVSAPPSETESTSLALLALSCSSTEKARGSVQNAKAWLLERQRADGSWPHSDAVPVSHWMTSLAVLALARSPEERPAAERGARWLLGQEGRGHSWLTRLLFRLFPEKKPVDLDWDLTGWPWMPDTFSWVEPTSYALLALKSLRAGLSDPRVEPRISEAERMILDRTCAEGGWNYGNSTVLGEELWPYPDTTALALMALQDRPRGDEIQHSLSALERMSEANDSILARSLAILAFQSYGRDVSALRTALVLQLENGDFPLETRAAAFAALALQMDANPLQLSRDA